MTNLEDFERIFSHSPTFFINNFIYHNFVANIVCLKEIMSPNQPPWLYKENDLVGVKVPNLEKAGKGRPQKGVGIIIYISQL